MRSEEKQARMDRIRELHAQGLTTEQIGPRVGRNSGSVSTTLRTMGLTPRSDRDDDADVKRALLKHAPPGRMFYYRNGARK